MTRNSKPRPGHVYVIANTAWPGWYKVGRASRLHQRLESYQTGSPHRDYFLVQSFKVRDAVFAEAAAHQLLASRHERQHEWFRIKELPSALDALSELVEKSNA
ncbi:GIY-YIG nuclease family protein [Nitrospirillum iridis]|uniref:GIY-YIG nuclease family protein n=1 Tax=Nitrospirillum iridis TaxID=765888 RepID=UPI00162096CD